MTPPRPRLTAVAACALTVAAVAAAPAAAFLDETVLVTSGATDEGVGPHLSVDGGLVVFASDADRLTPDQNDAVRNVLVRNTLTGATELISRATLGGPVANGRSFETSISSDGRRVAYGTWASNLDPADGESGSDIYVRDRVTGQTLLVSRASGAGGAKGDRPSFQSSISPDGGTVAFASIADNLTPGAVDGWDPDVFVRRVESPFTTTAVSVPPPSIAADARCQGPRTGRDQDFCGYGDSLWPAVARGGNIVAFESQAMKLVPGAFETTRDSDVFVRDVTAGVTTAVSVTPGGAYGNGPSTRPVISDDGEWVAFVSAASNLVSGDDNGLPDVFIRRLPNGPTVMVSRNRAGAPGNGPSANPDVSTTGRYVAYESDASNIAGGLPGVRNVFLWDRDTGETRLVSRATGAAGAPGDGGSTDPGISNDGRVVAFQSTATNLSPLDADGGKSIFIRDVLGVPRPVTGSGGVGPGGGGPPGGGGGPATAPPVAGAQGGAGDRPALVLGRVGLAGTWVRGRLRGGAVIVRVRADGRRTVRLAAARGRVARARIVTVPRGLTSIRLPLPPSTPPGPVVVTVTDGATTVDTARATLRGPVEGILRRFTVSVGSRGRDLRARGEFLSRPRAGIVIRFRGPGGRSFSYSLGPVRGFSRFIGYSRGLPAGRWVVTLRVAGRVTATRSVLVR